MATVFPADSLKKVIHELIPPELIPSDWSCTDPDPLKNVQSLLEKSEEKGVWSYFGDAEYILKIIRESIDFPGSSKFFEFPETLSCFTSTGIYNSEDGLLVYKHSLFFALKNTYGSSRPPFNELQTTVFDTIVTIYLRQREKLLTKNNELAPLRDKEFEDLRLSFDYHAKNFDKVLQKYGKTDFCKEFEKLIGKEGNRLVHRVVEGFSEQLEEKEIQPFLAKVYSWTFFVIRELDNFIEQHPQYFLANKDLNPSQRTLTVRCFEEFKGKVHVMAHELLEVLRTGNISYSKVKSAVDKMSHLGTFSFHQVARMLGANVNKVRFICVTTGCDSKLVNTLIPSYNGEGYCASALKVFVRLIFQLFVIKKVAQKYNWNHIHKFFDTVVVKFFDSTNQQGVYYIDYEDVRKIESLVQAHFPNRSPVAANFRCYPYSFTTEDIKNEIRHLKLNKLYGEIIEGVETRLENFTFQGNYMIGAIELCNLRCFLRRFPKLVQFLHHQQFCKMFVALFYCDICQGPKNLKANIKDPEDWNVADSEKVQENEKVADEKKKKRRKKKKKNVSKKVQEDLKVSSKIMEELEKEVEDFYRLIDESKDPVLQLEAEFLEKYEQMRIEEERKDELLERLKRLVAFQDQPQGAPEEEPHDCVICEEKIEKNEMNEPLGCKCKYRYHKKCIGDWLEIERTCPTCRADIK